MTILRQKVIIITGQLAALKSTVAKRLANDFSAVFISKDFLKERLAEKIKAPTRESNKQLSAATFLVMKDQLMSVVPIVDVVIIEANFKEHEYNQLIADLHHKKVLYKTIYLYAGFDVLYERYLKRYNTLHHTHKSMGVISPTLFKASMQYYDEVYKNKDKVEAIDTSLYNETVYQKIKSLLQ